MHQKKRQFTRAFTLAELVVAMAVLSMLVGAVISAIVVSARSIPDDDSLLFRRLEAMAALEQIADELSYATSINSTGITSAGVSSISFDVDDRGHGSPGVETIRYAWSGVGGDPLIRQYNGGSGETVIKRLDQFVITLVREEEPLDHLPVVLMMVTDSSSPSTESANKQALIESWDFQTRLVSSGASQTTFDTAASGADVIYLTNEVSIVSITSLLAKAITQAAMGVVTELGPSYSTLGVSTSYDQFGSASQIDVIDNTHFVTKEFSLGTLNTFSTSAVPVKATGSLAPGGDVLGEVGGVAALMAIDYDAQLSTGGTAATRIVKLPWAGTLFTIDKLSSSGQQLMRRSIVWAATPMVYASSTIKLRLTDDPDGSLQSATTILNRPR